MKKFFYRRCEPMGADVSAALPQATQMI